MSKINKNKTKKKTKQFREALIAFIRLSKQNAVLFFPEFAKRGHRRFLSTD